MTEANAEGPRMGSKALDPTHWTGAWAKVKVSPQEAGLGLRMGR